MERLQGKLSKPSKQFKSKVRNIERKEGEYAKSKS
jgi:hypothetical protein